MRRVVERDLTEQELAALRTAAEAVRAKQADVASDPRHDASAVDIAVLIRAVIRTVSGWRGGGITPQGRAGAGWG